MQYYSQNKKIINQIIGEYFVALLLLLFLYSGEKGAANTLVLWKGSCGSGQKEVSAAAGRCIY